MMYYAFMLLLIMGPVLSASALAGERPKPDSSAAILEFSGENSDKPYVPPTEMYPEGALQKSKSDEINEIKNLEKMKERAQQAQDDYEKQKYETELSIQNSKNQIQAAQIEQIKMQKELEVLAAEVAVGQGQLEVGSAIYK